MLHFQQDYLGCVGDEANILKKCDARRQVYSDNNFSSLSRWLGRLMSIPMTMTVAMYAISVPDVFVFENTLCCYDEQNKLDRYDEMFVRCCDVCCQCTFALGSAKSTLLIKQRKGMQEFISQKIYRTRGRDSRRRSATKGTRRIKSCTTFPSLLSSSCKHAQSTLYEPS